jgi:pyridoxamine 5'-phosphate oxidase
VTLRLHRADVGDDPIELFRRWFAAAREAGQPEPEAMALATADEAGRPSVRFVLMRGLDERGVVFYTNRSSRKGEELAARPWAAAVFRWKSVDRQVRIAGPVEEVSDAESDAYFSSRPRGSQLAAWASAQSRVVGGGRDELELSYLEVTGRFEGREVDRPPGWGGYRIRPDEMEFWQEGEYRMHDRFRFQVQANGSWRVERLAP